MVLPWPAHLAMNVQQPVMAETEEGPGTGSILSRQALLYLGNHQCLQAPADSDGVAPSLSDIQLSMYILQFIHTYIPHVLSLSIYMYICVLYNTYTCVYIFYNFNMCTHSVLVVFCCYDKIP